MIMKNEFKWTINNDCKCAMMIRQGSSLTCSNDNYISENPQNIINM